MSISISVCVMFGYALDKSDLIRRTPNPLFGKHKFDPDSGDKVTKFVEREIELGLDCGDNLPSMTRFTRFDTEGQIVLGVQMAELGDLMYGGSEPERIQFLGDNEREKVEAEAEKLMAKAQLPFKRERMGYYLVGEAS